jgi:hypothetical protein
MHQSSKSIGAFAAALAKAQCELTNPEKSLVGVISSPSSPNGDRAFRYAPLSSGLDIVRTTLGSHEIAIVQTTAVDKEAGLIRLTTILAHSSGEWISSDWPVCPVSETAAPQRMGAALTYARRYALFSLVGIAGEDDLDAPDLLNRQLAGRGDAAKGNGHAVSRPPALPVPDSRRGTRARPLKETLTAAVSADLRDKLQTELAALSSTQELSDWTVRALPAKNSLSAEDAHIIEEAFAAKLAAQPLPEVLEEGAGGEETEPRGAGSAESDNAALALPKTCRRRNRKHLEFVSKKPCLVCGRSPADAHHLRFAQPRALGRKVSDEFTVPLCRTHHRQLHSRGNEIAWWKTVRIDPSPIAQRLWSETRR